MGAMSESDESGYRAAVLAPPMNMIEVDAALDQLSRAETEALVANVLFVAGGALVVGGLIWLLVAGNDDSSSPLAVAPIVTPDGAGLVMAGTFGGAL